MNAPRLGASAHRQVLIIDNDEQSLSLAQSLENEGVGVQRAYSLSQARPLLRSLRFNVVVSEATLPDGDGEAVLQEASSLSKANIVIFTARAPRLSQAVSMIRGGALDYLDKPYEPVPLAQRIRGLIDARQTAERAASLSDLPARSAAMAAVTEKMRRLTGSSVSILIMGGPGSGKRTLAKRLHRGSARALGPFVEIRGSSLEGASAEGLLFGGVASRRAGDEPERWPGALEQAADGSLYISRIEETPRPAQAMLLRVFDEGGFYPAGAGRLLAPFRARLICSTELPMDDLKTRVDRDLLDRISNVEIDSPPLRARMEDLEPLATALLADCCFEVGCEAPHLDADVLPAARLHDWPGNVKELKARLLRAVSLGGGETIKALDLFPDPAGTVRMDAKATSKGKTTAKNLDEARASAERVQILQTLASTEGRIGDAARILGVSRVTLWMKMKRLGLQQGSDRSRPEESQSP